MMFARLSWPLKWLPQPVTAVSLGIILNLFFKRYPELQERLAELAGKLFHFEVEDLGQSFYMAVDDTGEVRIHTYADTVPHVVMAGSTEAFLSLLFATTDPDSLFFSRRLKLSGETDTGLQFKNILDNVDIDWEKELAVVMGGPGARFAVALTEQAKKVGEHGREKAESRFEQWLDAENVPRRAKMIALQEQVTALSQRVERLDRRVLRTSRKGYLSRAPH